MNSTRSMHEKKKVLYKLSLKEPEWMRPLRKPTSRCQDLTEIVCVCVCVVDECINIAQRRIEWWTYIYKPINPRVLLKIWEHFEELSG